MLKTREGEKGRMKITKTRLTYTEPKKYINIYQSLLYIDIQNNRKRLYSDKNK